MGQAPNSFLDVTVIVETYNLTEGADFDRLRRVLEYVEQLRKQRLGVQTMLADASEMGQTNDLALGRLAVSYPRLRVVRVPGAGYEGIKFAAVQAAATRFIAYVDGDCLPQDDGWLDHLLAPLQSGAAEVTAGTTFYEAETLWSQTLSIMDFGFLLESSGGPIGCYASNNVAFVRARWLQTAPPAGPLRCTCYAHTQQLARQNALVIHLPLAVLRHELPTLFAERWRRGYDLVAVCWADPHLRDARWLRYGVLAAPIFYAQNLALDWRRMSIGTSRFGWSSSKRLAAIGLAALIRLIDLAGIVRALILGPARRWSAYGTAADRDNLGPTSAGRRLENPPNRA